MYSQNNDDFQFKTNYDIFSDLLNTGFEKNIRDYFTVGGNSIYKVKFD